MVTPTIESLLYTMPVLRSLWVKRVLPSTTLTYFSVGSEYKAKYVM